MPRLVQSLSEAWGIELDASRPSHGYNSFVLLAHRGDEECALKLTWPPDRTIIETRALEAWGGSGAVRLMEADAGRGALLLERLDASRTLNDLDLPTAAVTAGKLLERLTIDAPTAAFPRLGDIAREIAESLEDRQNRLGDPVPHGWVTQAHDLARSLGEASGCRLVHADLHYGNVLAGEREDWLAIDPKPVVGDPEYAVPELLWTSVDEVDAADGVRHVLEDIVAGGHLDFERARGWAVVRCVDYWLWGLANGLTEDPKRCERALRALLG